MAAGEAGESQDSEAGELGWGGYSPMLGLGEIRKRASKLLLEGDLRGPTVASGQLPFWVRV